MYNGLSYEITMRKLLASLLLAGLLVGCTTNTTGDVPVANVEETPSSVPPTMTITQDGVRARLFYKQGNKWDYILNTDLPNPCYTFAHTVAQVTTSQPEQANLDVSMTAPEAGASCTKTRLSVEQQGTFTAGEDAEVTLTVTFK